MNLEAAFAGKVLPSLETKTRNREKKSEVVLEQLSHLHHLSASVENGVGFKEEKEADQGGGKGPGKAE